MEQHEKKYCNGVIFYMRNSAYYFANIKYYSISAGFIVGRDDNYRELGIYHTEKRAKEVLKEIYISYANWQMINIPKVEIHEEISTNRIFGTICYRMPER